MCGGNLTYTLLGESLHFSVADSRFPGKPEYDLFLKECVSWIAI